jgi:hypothetical protein
VRKKVATATAPKLGGQPFPPDGCSTTQNVLENDSSDREQMVD